VLQALQVGKLLPQQRPLLFDGQGHPVEIQQVIPLFQLRQRLVQITLDYLFIGLFRLRDRPFK
jgi:hypothetical protein